ncbi:PEP/pyruvate-binding domain-containing protein [Maridesulfovibrio frigidus]|uniref:PEP/pyruvate-binding domain-containing protein n=1 Tax=Maridesulfovibrio frigidus TaxID=340956 RepID=UPI000554D6FD|nr:PEP/pyruvate-binding domain-containing protein [Maridesulfovibrio frigidus]
MQIKQLFRHWACLCFAPGELLRHNYDAFKSLLDYDATALELIADIEDVFYGKKLADHQHVVWLMSQLSVAVKGMVDQLFEMNPLLAKDLQDVFESINSIVSLAITQTLPESCPPYTFSLLQASSFPELSGGKGANLSHVAMLRDIQTPPGFVVTSNAFNKFIQFNGLEDEIESRLRLMKISDRNLLAKLTLEMQELILAADVPPEVADSIGLALAKNIPSGSLIAVRSSALSEDSEISFAGQYSSELNIKQFDVLEAYKRVLAGKYCPRAVSYRISNGLSDDDTAMAALIIPMIDVQNAGVVYSKNPEEAGCCENICVYGVQGMGDSLVDGSISPAKAVLSRDFEPSLISKEQTTSDALPSEGALTELARIAMLLENYFGGPQDIEWATDQQENIFVLQTRPLQGNHGEACAEHPPLVVNSIVKDLERASLGVGCGEIYFAKTGEDFPRIPEGAIVVTPTLSPALLMFVDVMSGVLSTTGSRASHFASVARENGLPVLVGDVANLFQAGQIVTVDGLEGAVYDGCVEAVLTRSRTGRAIYPRVIELYSDIVPFVCKLSLTDPEAEDFSAKGCRSFHDLVRFCHEKSTREMFLSVDKKGWGMGASRLLKSDLPLVMYILDLGKGINSGAVRDSITPQDITSVPMLALWRGLSDAQVKWSKELTHIDWDEFDRISSGIFSLESKVLASYGTVSDDYLHLLIRFGYHFSVVDSICGQDERLNYIKFRFKGGGSGLDNKVFRLEFISQVLDSYGFEINIRGDMLDAVCRRMSENDTFVLLVRLGYLLAVTRLMDMRLESTDQVAVEFTKFMDQVEELDGNHDK